MITSFNYTSFPFWKGSLNYTCFLLLSHVILLKKTLH